MDRQEVEATVRARLGGRAEARRRQDRRYGAEVVQTVLKRSARAGIKDVDFNAVERKHNLTLPQDYKDFVAVAGPKTFSDVNDMEGSTTSVLLPQQLDFDGYRRGKVPHLENEDAEVDGVVFAVTSLVTISC